jgi:hypothetical protein
MNLQILTSFDLSTINSTILLNFEKEWCTFIKEKDVLKFFKKTIHLKLLSVLSLLKDHQFASNFGH